jgi:hypothetical protein
MPRPSPVPNREFSRFYFMVIVPRYEAEQIVFGCWFREHVLDAAPCRTPLLPATEHW